MLAMASMAFAGTQARADAVPQPTMTKHEMIVKTVVCMRKRMSIDRAVSYNEAARTCKAQISKPSDHSSGALPRVCRYYEPLMRGKHDSSMAPAPRVPLSAGALSRAFVCLAISRR
jgi:hypothetical protein